MSSPPSVRKANADFGIEIDFAPSSPDPARVFRSMTQLIDAFQRFDRELVQTIDIHIEPVMLLEDIETGSIKSWLRAVLSATDDTGLHELNWKKIVGGYLVRAKYLTIDWLNKKTEISGTTDLDELQGEILDLAEATEVKRIPAYQAPSKFLLVRSIIEITGSLGQLQENDHVVFETQQGERVEFNLTIRVVPETLKALLVEESLSHTEEMILKVKKPDFLGDSRWEFVHEHIVEARMMDYEWLERFRNGEITLLPGSALRGSVQVDVSYSVEREVVSRTFTILKVHEVIPPPAQEQGGLLPE
jgi:hypothetical protein